MKIYILRGNINVREGSNLSRSKFLKLDTQLFNGTTNMLSCPKMLNWIWFAFNNKWYKIAQF